MTGRGRIGDTKFKCRIVGKGRKSKPNRKWELEK